MRMLVTGGAGFIGSHIVDRLLMEKHDVAVADNLSSGTRGNVPFGVEFYEVDLTSPGLTEAITEFKPDVVFHEAAQINVRKSIENPTTDAKTNIIGSINLLEACRKNNVKKIIYASSGGAVYGEPQKLPVPEDHPIKPLSQYGASKHAVEHYLEIYRQNYDLNYTILRYSNVYGPRQNPNGEAGVIAIFAKAFLNGSQPVIFGDGNQTRDFIYAADVAQANLLAAQKKTPEKTFNVGSGTEISINKITDLISKATDAKTKPKYGPEVPGEVRHTYLDISRAKKELGWQPKKKIEDGIKETVEWIKNGD
ncbi:GDP-L-fucose synthase [uncultured archaeon]|nr:GDP-L-fucose synthase [uncultured archaeon]